MARPTFRLSQITQRVEELLRPAYGKQFWVRAEIGSGNVRGDNFYGELVETAGGKVIAKLRVTVWGSELARIRKKFEREGLTLELSAGTAVGLFCVLSFDQRHGLSLRGLDMDPAVALGELERRRRKVLERLTADALLERNAALPVARVPRAIALVTSRDSAACKDFLTTLERSGFGFRTYLLDSAVQGADAAASMLRALRRAARLPVDVVVITRGGGSKVDLAALDDEAIARAIAAHPLPVWTAIGHETDTSVLDHVAGRSFKTPTAVAEELVRLAQEAATLLDDARRRLRTVWRLRQIEERRLLSESRVGLEQGSRKLLELRRAQLNERARAVDGRVRARLVRELTTVASHTHDLRGRGLQALRDRHRTLGDAGRELGRRGRRSLEAARTTLTLTRGRLRREPLVARIAAERRTLGAWLAQLAAADPRTALKRGFALLRDASGGLVRSVAQASPGDAVSAELGDGRLGLEVTSREDRETNE